VLQTLPSSVGRSLSHVRAGAKRLAIHGFRDCRHESLLVDSSAFHAGASLPPMYTADSRGVSPPLTWRRAPDSAVSIVLIIEDADSPSQAPMVHGMAWVLGRPTGHIKESALNRTSEWMLPTLGRNSYLRSGYLPPDPPPGHGLHRYFFQLFALDCSLQLSRTPGRSSVLKAMRGHVLAKGALMGTYERR
jgi:Raf kinase inhibitor-like YbhB/YbcL family protein